jgi:serine/threonine protein kinase
MEDRYEIRGKLGQGGLGAVYRAWDHALKREVAVKRILSGDEGTQRDEATRQMEKETGALAALQHPNIVTIYDVGSDEDGPFVVMELLTGQTLDEIVERAPLTWTDFRELVVQIQEALIAAQDLGLVHRDLKPSNVMLNWLPSGRFQAKIVDFGLAKFSPKPSVQTVDHSDSVFGSIFFMAPEQFERVALDPRADMYSIGCVYYFTLTGQSPFQGDTGPQVMAAHLEHRVVPLVQLRHSWIG